VSAGWLYTHGVATDGALYYWGNLNDSEYLGSTLVPVRIADNFESVSAGMYHACGVRVGGAAYCWGIDEQGELGNGVVGESSQVPTPVSGELTFKFVSAGGYAHTCGITTTGAAFCWGGNQYGQLGNGGTAKSPSPVPVSGALTFATISSGLTQTCGVTTDGAIYCWGSNESGELGIEKVKTVTEPTRVFGMP
jgi:alpha-tubulin suppressor-like RCC1 family protein